VKLAKQQREGVIERRGGSWGTVDVCAKKKKVADQKRGRGEK